MSLWPAFLAKPATDRYTLQRGRSRFLVLHKFSVAESAQITDALQRPGTFVFTETGDLEMDGVVIANPLVSRKMRSRGGLTLQEVRQTDPHFTWDASSVVSRNLKYLLLKDDTSGLWHLAYNPLHRRGFKAFYDEVMRTDADNPARDAHYWGATTSAKGDYPALRDVFQQYCGDLTTTDDRGNVAYLDPTCNYLVSSEQCVQSAFFRDSRVDHLSDPTRRNKYAAAASIVSWLRADHPAGAVRMPNCLCKSKIGNFANRHLQANESFARSFQGRQNCDLQYSITDCSINVVGDNLDVADNLFSNNCGNAVDASADAEATAGGGGSGGGDSSGSGSGGGGSGSGGGGSGSGSGGGGSGGGGSGGGGGGSGGGGSGGSVGSGSGGGGSGGSGGGGGSGNSGRGGDDAASGADSPLSATAMAAATFVGVVALGVGGVVLWSKRSTPPARRWPSAPPLRYDYDYYAPPPV
jgi:hypothetical protein